MIEWRRVYKQFSELPDYGAYVDGVAVCVDCGGYNPPNITCPRCGVRMCYECKYRRGWETVGHGCAACVYGDD